MPQSNRGASRRSFLKSLSISAAALAVPGSLSGCRSTRQPNIVLILADDLGHECLGCYGGRSYSTPNLDALAASGMRFQHCYSQPLCTPTRVQLMTGKYNFRNYIGFGVLAPTEKTFGHFLQEAGYATCVAGKWQLWGVSDAHGMLGKGVYPEEAGFAEYCLWAIDHVEGRHADPFLHVNQREPHLFQGEYGPDICCNYLCDFMTRNRDVPFLAYYPMLLPHPPFVPTPDSAEWNGAERKKVHPKFFADMVRYMDAIVGRIVARLEQLGLRERTLIMFLADNGTPAGVTSRKGNQTIPGQKGLPTDGGTRVPLIANWPGVIPPNSVSNDLVDTTDFLPTIADVSGFSLPEDVPFDGRSFFRQLRGEKGNPRQWILCDHDPQWFDAKGCRFARDQRWKLHDDGRLFDVPADPLEEHPIEAGKGSQEAEAARIRLQEVLAEFSRKARMKRRSSAATIQPRSGNSAGLAGHASLGILGSTLQG